MKSTEVRSRQRAGALWVLVVACVTACYDPRPPAGAPCEDDSGCPTTQRCIQNRCSGPAADAASGLDGRADAPVDARRYAGIDAPPDAPPPGFCVDATDCTSANPCEVMACTNNQCVATARPNGASCGSAGSIRCCGGTCVDISTDRNNCGGCGLACAAGRSCESVAVTTSCPQFPPATSGRCTCANANAECPGSQICRTETPVNNRCSPNLDSSCAPGQSFVEVFSCPNYCRY